MNIEGLDYNTKRERLILPEYGREIQNMVNYAVALPNKADRQRCAETIIAIMERMFPQTRENMDYKQKFWDHLILMSDFKLDIDYPFDMEQARKIATKPEPMPYPMKKIPVRHYGNLMFEVFQKIKDMEPGKQRDELIRQAANQMKYDLAQWSHGSNDDEKVADDLARFTDGKAQLDLNTFKFAKVNTRDNEKKRKKK
jgi:hypothetical protein